MKRSLKSVLAASIVLGTMVPSVFAANSNTDGMPTDISGNQFAPAIELMLEKNVMINFTGNQFQPDQPATRGQFIAYIYNILKNEGVITQDYTGSNPYSDEDVNFQKQINDMYLFGYLDGLSFTTKKGADAIGEYWKAPVPWISELLCNVAGVSYDNTKPWSAYVAAVGQGWFANTGYSNGKMPSNSYSSNGYYMTRAEMAQLLENFYASQYPNSINGVPVNLKLAAANATTAQGTSDQLTLSGTDINGKAATLDNTQVTYSVSAADTKTTASDGFVNNNGVFTATAPGSYTVTAMYGSVLSASTTINVYGSPASLAIAPAAALVADPKGASSTTVTVKVYDANNNLVTNYNGQVTLTSSADNEVSFANGSDTSSATVNAVNGVATFTVYTGSGAASGQAPTLTATVPNSSATGTATEQINTPAATSFSLGYATNAPNGLAVNMYNSQTSVVATVKDQAGNTLSSYNGWATVTISGPATLLGSTTTTEQVWIGAGVSNPIQIEGEQGKTGSVVVSVSATGLSTQTMTIPAYNQTAPASIVATASANTVATGDYTTVTIKELDSNGNLAVLGSTGQPNNATIALAQNSGSSNVIISDTQPTTGVTPTASSTVALQNGQATVYVYNENYTGSANLTLTDSLLTTSVPLSFTTGSASQIVPVTSAVYAAQGAAVSETFQLEDSAGNAIKTAGDTFTVGSNNPSASLSATSGTTDANGQFTVTVTLPSADGAVTGVTATESGSTTGISAGTATLTTRSAQNLATNVTGYVYDPSTSSNEPISNLAALLSGSNGSLPAGGVLNMNAWGLNAVGQQIQKNDSISVTSSNDSIVAVNTSGNASANITGEPYVANSQPPMPTATDGGAHVVQLLGKLAGTATITVTDTSVATKPSYTFNVTVAAQQTPATLAVTGLSDNQVVQAGQTYALTVQLADAGGNPVFLGANPANGLQVDAYDYTENGSNQGGPLNDFRSAANGYTTSQTNIPAYGGNAVIYWTAPASSTTTNGTTISLKFNTNYNGQTISGSITGITVQ